MGSHFTTRNGLERLFLSASTSATTPVKSLPAFVTLLSATLQAWFVTAFNLQGKCACVHHKKGCGSAIVWVQTHESFVSNGAVASSSETRDRPWASSFTSTSLPLCDTSDNDTNVFLTQIMRENSIDQFLSTHPVLCTLTPDPQPCPALALRPPRPALQAATLFPSQSARLPQAAEMHCY